MHNGKLFESIFIFSGKNLHSLLTLSHGEKLFKIILWYIRAVAGQRARLLLAFVKHKAKTDQ